MSIHCNVIVQPSATPEQLSAVGAALWRWYTRAEENSIYQYLDNQGLADLIAGKLPASRQAESDLHFRIRDETSQDRRATIARLRRAMPANGVEDIVVDGTSWNL